MNIGELFVKLGVVGDTSGLKKFSDGVENAYTGVVNLKNALGIAMLYGVERFISSTVDGVVALQNLNNQTGLSIEQLKKWQIAGQLSNIAMSAQEITNSIGNLQKNLTAIRMGGGNVRPFQLLGIDIAGKDSFQVLEEIRSRIHGMSRPMATNLLEQAGLSGNFINLLTTSREEFEKLSNVKFLNKEQRDKVMLLGTEFQKLKINLSNLKDIMIADLFPVFDGVLKLITNMTNGFSWISDKITHNQDAVRGLVVTFIALAAVLFPIQTLIAGLLLAIDDLVNYFDTNFKGKTLTERMFGQNPKEFVDGLKNMSGQLTNTLGIDSKSSPMSFLGDKLNEWSGLKDLKDALKAGNTQTVNVNSTNHIHSNGDPKDVADEITNQQTRQFKSAITEMNNGAVR